MTPDDTVAAAIAGDRAAFALLWRRLNRPVAAYLRARGVVQVEDVTSEVFVSALHGISRFRGDFDAFKTWLFTIAHHRSVDDLRRRAKEEAGVALVVADGGEQQCAGADEEALAYAERAAAFELLRLLTPEQQAVVLLRILADFSVEETASILRRSPDAVKKLQRRALARLRRELTPDRAVPLRALPAIAAVR